MKLLTAFSKAEEQELAYLDKDRLTILSELTIPCFILNDYGSLTYEQCFGETESAYWKAQRFQKLIPRRAFRYYDRFFLEPADEPGCWTMGFLQDNGAVQCLAYCDDLGDALDSM